MFETRKTTKLFEKSIVSNLAKIGAGARLRQRKIMDTLKVCKNRMKMWKWKKDFEIYIKLEKYFFDNNGWIYLFIYLHTHFCKSATVLATGILYCYNGDDILMGYFNLKVQYCTITMKDGNDGNGVRSAAIDVKLLWWFGRNRRDESRQFESVYTCQVCSTWSFRAMTVTVIQCSTV